VIPPNRDPDRCPTCKTFVAGNRSRRTDSADRKALNRILAGLRRDYQPKTEPEHAQRRALASVIAKLELVRVGGNEHQRLVNLLEDLKGTLDESRAARVQPPESDLSKLTAEQLRQRALDLAAQFEVMQRSDVEQAERIAAQHREEEAAVLRRAPTAPSPEPKAAPEIEPECPRFKKSLSDCTTMREKSLDLWRTLHYNDPAEVKRRREHATAVMMRAIACDVV
jgi:hypothetical protein